MARAYVFTFAKTISRSIFRKTSTHMHPMVKRAYYPLTRGHIFNEIEICIFCGLCDRRCPTHAITVKKETKEFELRSLQCITCGICVDVCPKKCLIMKNEYYPAVFSRDESVDYYRQTGGAVDKKVSGSDESTEG